MECYYYNNNNHIDYGNNNNNNNNSEEGVLPPGFRFHPTDEELITYYLVKKVVNNTFNGIAIAEVDLNKCEPWELPEKAKMGEKEWYFFNLRDRKYPTGLRTNRATLAGYWKATGKDREIICSKTWCLVGMKKTLVFYKGRAPKGEKSKWIMHEYRLDGKLAYHYLCRSSKDEWVISRVFQKATKTNYSKKKRLMTNTNTNTATSSDHNMSLCLELPTSPSSSLYYLPPLLEDSSPYTITTTTTEHVSCFSNNNNFINGSFDFAPQPLTMDPFACFPRNLQLPFFFSPLEHNFSSGGSDELAAGNRPMPTKQSMADGGSNMPLRPSKLDYYMWGC